MDSIILDMDGTIAGLYDYPDWLKHLKAERVRPYVECEPIVDMDELASLIAYAQRAGVTCKVVSWGAKGSSMDYLKATRKAKLEWLKKHLPDVEFDSIHVTRYGASKTRYAGNDSIIVDDSPFILSSWYKGRTIDAMNKNWLKNLRELVAMTVESC